MRRSAHRPLFRPSAAAQAPATAAVARYFSEPKNGAITITYRSRRIDLTRMSHSLFNPASRARFRTCAAAFSGYWLFEMSEGVPLMPQNVSRAAGRHFLQIPGPTPIPDRVLRAMDTPIIDHRGPEFAKLAKRCLENIKTIFKTTNPVIIYTATGTGAWEAALVNTMSPGDRVLMIETGQFATLWKNMATKLGLKPEFVSTDWRIGADPAVIEAKLREDKAHEIKAVCVLHNETATGCLSPIAEIR